MRPPGRASGLPGVAWTGRARLGSSLAVSPLTQRLFHIPQYALRVAAVLVLLAAGLVVVLTRTQVGRDAVAGQAVAAFNRTYAGRVEVGRVTGTLVRDLYARDLRLYAPGGALVLAADSVVLRPTWRSLFRRTFEADEVALLGLRLDLRRDGNGAWNLAEALRTRRPGPSSGAPFELHAADLRIEGGQVSVAMEGAPPRSVAEGRVFDYRHALVADLDAELTLDWRDGVQRIGIRQASFELPRQDVSVETLAARLTRTEEGLAAEGLRLVTPRSRLAAAVRLDTRPGEAPTLDATIREGRLAAADLRAFFPSLPLNDQVTVQGRVQGPPSDLRVSDLQLARGETRLRAAGRVHGLPDALAFDLDVAQARVRAEDLRALLPEAPLPDLLARLGLATAEGAVSGGLRNGTLELDADLALVTEAGAAEGTLRIERAPGRPLRFHLDADAEDVDPGRITGDARWEGAIFGAITAHSPADSLGGATTFRVRLGPSRLAGRSADSLAAEGILRGRRLDARLALRQGASRLDGTVRADRAATLHFDGELVAFDLRRLLPEAPATRLTGPLRLDLAAPSLAALRADLDGRFTEAAVASGGRLHALPAGPVRLVVSPPQEPGPRLGIDTPFAEATIEGGVDAEAALALAPYWAASLAHAARTAYDKPLRGEPALRPPPVPPDLDRPARPFALSLQLTDPDALRALVPAFPDVAAGTTVEASGTLGSDALDLAFEAKGDGIGVASTRLSGFHVNGRLRRQREGDGVTAPALTLAVTADSLRLGTWKADAPHLDLDLLGDRAEVALAARRPGNATQIDLAGSVRLLPDRNRLTLTRTHLDVGDSRWAAAGPQVVNLYADAAVIRALELVRSDEGGSQRVALRGVLSDAPADTLYADVDGFDLGEIARSAGAAWQGAYLGGHLDARLAVTRPFSRPEVTGAVAVPRLLFGDRLLGRLDLTSRFVPGDDALTVDLRLARPAADAPIPYPLRLEENDLRVSGRIRLPGRTAGGGRDPGLLDLDLAAERADLFFFDYLFPDLVEQARGYVSGEGRIGGDFSYPLFEADLAAHAAAAAIPRFGLAFEGDGRVHVDRRGIHLDDVRLTDEGGGTATVGGSVLFNDYRFFSLDLRADLREVEVVDVPDGGSGLPFYGAIRASGAATVTGPLDHVFLRSADAVTTPDSEIFIPVASSAVEADRGFLVFADADGRIPRQKQRTSVVGPKPEGERTFSEGFEMSLNLSAPPGSTVHLVFDPRVGDVIDARGRADLQLTIREGDFRTFGTFTASGGSYAFVAGEVFTRRFGIEPGGTLTWDGDPLDARLDLTADFRTRASLAGLGLAGLDDQRVPLVIRAHVGGRLTSPLVDLALDLDADARSGSTDAAAEALRPLLNDADRQALYATSVLLTGTFLLAPVENLAAGGDALTGAADALLYTSLSQLVSSRLNLFLSQALASDHVEVLLGVQPADDRIRSLQDFDLTYGVALRFLDERLVIRGEGVYQQLENRPARTGLEGEVVVEVRLTPAVALEVFYRRERELLGGTSVGVTPYGAYGAGLRYETAFTSWPAALRQFLGRTSASG